MFTQNILQAGGYDSYEYGDAACENHLFSQAYVYKRAFPLPGKMIFGHQATRSQEDQKDDACARNKSYGRMEIEGKYTSTRNE